MLNQDKRDYRTAVEMIAIFLSVSVSCRPLRFQPVLSSLNQELHFSHIKSFVTIQFCLLCMFGLSNTLFLPWLITKATTEKHMNLIEILLVHRCHFFVVIQFKQSHFRLFCENYQNNIFMLMFSP